VFAKRQRIRYNALTEKTGAKMPVIKIVSYKIKPKQFRPFVMFVNRLICMLTVSKFWHTAIILDGVKYESGHPFGAKKSYNIPYQDKYHDIENIVVTNEQLHNMITYAENKLIENLRYNHYKLILLSILYPTRFIWDRIKWVPFQNDYFGMVCSVFAREILLAGDINYCPKRYKEITAPRDMHK
jgi:hypothetical protein